MACLDFCYALKSPALTSTPIRGLQRIPTLTLILTGSWFHSLELALIPCRGGGGVGVSVQDGNEKARPLFAPLMGSVGVLPEIFAMPRHVGILVLPLVVVIVPEYRVTIKHSKRVLYSQG